MWCYEDDLSVDATGKIRWGRSAAGLLIVLDEDEPRVLLTLRSDLVMDTLVSGRCRVAV